MDFYKFYFRKVPSKGYYVALEVMKRAYKVNKLDNLFEDDDSENYEVIFTEEQVDDMNLFNRCTHRFPGQKSIEGFDIYGVNIALIEGGHFQHFLNNQGQVHLSDSEKENIKNIRDMIKKKFRLKDGEKLIQFLRRKYMFPIQDEVDNRSEFLGKHHNDKWTKEVRKLCIKNNISIPNDLVLLYHNPDTREMLRDFDASLNETTKAEYNRIYEELLLKKKVPVRWTSEFELFKLIKKYFDDAMFQHSPSWLFPQRFDIYIPSIKTAFEYQGIQHYETVEFFGGEQGLKKRIALDNLKREKSKENEISVIEWKYDETLTKVILNKKLKEIGLDKI